MFNKKKSVKDVQIERKTVGPVTHEVSLVNPGEDRIWSSMVDDVHIPCLTLAKYFMDIFPRADLGYFHCQYEFTSSTRPLIASWNLDQFNEKKFVLNIGCNVTDSNFASKYSKSSQLSVISAAGNNECYKVFTTKKFGAKELPINSELWFSQNCVLGRHFNYIVISGLKVRTEAWRDVINRWVNGKIMNLVLLRATDIKNLIVSELTEGFDTHEWDETEMLEFAERTEFSLYYNQKGTIIRDKEYRRASIHFDDKSSILSFVVWDTKASKKCLSLYPEIEATFL